MSTYIVVTSVAILSFGIMMIGFPDESSTLMVVLVTSGVVLYLFRRYSDEKDLITILFVGALVVRLAFGIFLHVYDLRIFFGGDSITYHLLGGVISDYWLGLVDPRETAYQYATMTSRPGWGMNYLVAGIYMITGKNILAAQSFCAVIGAATAPMVYFLAEKVFGNRRVARTAAFAVAFFPAFVIWSAQLLKDGIVIFLLVLSITMVLQLQEKFSYAAVIVLISSLFGIITLRFYIFYMVGVAVAGSFIVGSSNKSTSILRRAAVLTLLGLGLTYLGVIRNASVDFEKYADLERVQLSRFDLARSAESGFSEDADVSTAEGAITTVPVGFAYLMFAPFPWQVSSFRQAITVPEVLLWWALIPFMIAGIIYAIKHRLKSTFPILFFSAILTLAYSIFQGNVGTAYRQRTQIQVFLFIFIAVGWQLWRERREDRRIEEKVKQREFSRRIQQQSSQI